MAEPILAETTAVTDLDRRIGRIDTKLSRMRGGLDAVRAQRVAMSAEPGA